MKSETAENLEGRVDVLINAVYNKNIKLKGIFKMAYKKKAETKERVETIFDVKGELTFWVKTGSNGKLYASTSVKNSDGDRMFYSVFFRKDVDLTDFDEGMNRINVKSGFITCSKIGESVRPKIMVLDFE